MLRIVDAIDVERGGEQLWIEPVHHANASDLAARLTEIFPLEPGGPAERDAGDDPHPHAAPKRAAAQRRARRERRVRARWARADCGLSRHQHPAR